MVSPPPKITLLGYFYLSYHLFSYFTVVSFSLYFLLLPFPLYEAIASLHNYSLVLPRAKLRAYLEGI